MEYKKLVEDLCRKAKIIEYDITPVYFKDIADEDDLYNAANAIQKLNDMYGAEVERRKKQADIIAKERGDKYALIEERDRLKVELDKAKNENLSRELASFEEHRDLHYWRDLARELQAKLDAAEGCIDNIEDDNYRGNTNDWITSTIAEWRDRKEKE